MLRYDDDDEWGGAGVPDDDELDDDEWGGVDSDDVLELLPLGGLDDEPLLLLDEPQPDDELLDELELDVEPDDELLGGGGSGGSSDPLDDEPLGGGGSGGSSDPLDDEPLSGGGWLLDDGGGGG